MDRWEGAQSWSAQEDPLPYRPGILRHHHRSRLAWLYVVDAWEGGLPSARYIGVMPDAAEVAGAPAEYGLDLRTRPACNVGPGPAE